MSREIRRAKQATPMQRAEFDRLFCDGTRYAVLINKNGAFEIWDTSTDKIVATKHTRDAANQFVEAMGK